MNRLLLVDGDPDALRAPSAKESRGSAKRGLPARNSSERVRTRERMSWNSTYLA